MVLQILVLLPTKKKILSCKYDLKKEGKKKIFLVGQHCENLKPWTFNPLTPTSDQDRISPHNINSISSRQVMRITKNMN